MSILAVLPVKDLSQSKSRLSRQIDRRQREVLALGLLRRTLGVLKSAQDVDSILLVSRDARVRSLAEAESAGFLLEEGTGLNQALEQATAWSVDQGFSAILILPLDLPFVSKEDIDAITAMANGARESVIIAPDRELKGTNALLVRPPGILQYQFGVESFWSHCQQAQDRHIESRIYYSSRTSFDVDSPDQYRAMVQQGLPELELCRKP